MINKIKQNTPLALTPEARALGAKRSAPLPLPQEEITSLCQCVFTLLSVKEVLWGSKTHNRYAR